MPRTIKKLDIDAVKYLAHSLAKEMLNWNEPIPEFETRYPNILESCIGVPFQTYDRKLLYKGLDGKAAVLFYLLIKNHPFQNGNKRIAVTSLLVLLYLNKKWLSVDQVQLYNFAKWVAQSPPELREEVLLAVKKFIDRSMSKFPVKTVAD